MNNCMDCLEFSCKLFKWKNLKKLLLNTLINFKKSLFVLFKYFWWVFTLLYLAISFRNKIVFILFLIFTIFITLLSIFFNGTDTNYKFLLKKMLLSPKFIVVKFSAGLFSLVMFYALVFAVCLLFYPRFNFFWMADFLLPCFALTFFLITTFAVFFLFDTNKTTASIVNGFKMFFYFLPLTFVFSIFFLFFGILFLLIPILLLPQNYNVYHHLLWLDFPWFVSEFMFLNCSSFSVFLNVLFIELYRLFCISFCLSIYQYLKEVSRELFDNTSLWGIGIFLATALFFPVMIIVGYLQKQYIKSNNSDLNYSLAMKYSTGKDCEQDRSLAKYYFEKSDKQYNSK